MPRIVHERSFLEQSFRCLHALAFVCVLVWFCGVTGFSSLAYAQTPAPSAPAAATKISAQHKTHPHKRRHMLRHSKKPVAAPLPAPPVVPAAPVYPIPPAQQPAVPAQIVYDGHQLTIKAENASLTEILTEVGKQTGMTVSGLNGDMRVYGNYGPGTVNQTLTALLNGCPYNFVIIGGDATHPPKQLQLSLSNGTQ